MLYKIGGITTGIHHVTVRVQRFQENFLKERLEGRSVKEVFEKYQVSRGHAYKVIEKLEKKHGVPKGTYLDQPFIIVNKRICPAILKDDKVNTKGLTEVIEQSESDLQLMLGFVEEHM